MYQNALRAGLPVTKRAMAANRSDGHDEAGQPKPRQIGDHKVDLGRQRKFFTNDLLHVSVQLVPGSSDRPHNNPGTPLAVIDDDGIETEPAGA